MSCRHTIVGELEAAKLTGRRRGEWLSKTKMDDRRWRRATQRENSKASSRTRNAKQEEEKGEGRTLLHKEVQPTREE